MYLFGSKIAFEPDSLGYITFFNEINFLRTPGYPLFMLLFPPVICTQTAQILLSCASLGLVYLIVYKMSEKIQYALLACAAFMLDFCHYEFDLKILSENLFYFLMLLALYLLVMFIKNKRTLYFVLFTLVMNYALLTRPILLYFNFLLCAAFLLFAFKKKIKWTQAAFFILVFACIFLGWSARNYHYGKVFTFSTVKNHNLLYYDSAVILQRGLGIAEDKARYIMHKRFVSEHNTDGLTEAQIAVLQGKTGLAFLNAHKLEYLEQNLTGIRGILIGEGFHNNLFLKIFTKMFLLLLYAFYAYGLFRRKLTITDIYILALCAYLIIASAPAGYYRFRVAFLPLLIVGAFMRLRKN